MNVSESQFEQPNQHRDASGEAAGRAEPSFRSDSEVCASVAVTKTKQRRKVTRARLKQLKAARAKRTHSGRALVENPSKNTLRMRAFRARRRAEVAEAKRLAKKAAKHQYWLNYKVKHPNTRVNKPKPSVVIDGKKFLIPPATFEAWYAPDLSYEEALAFVKTAIVPAQTKIAGEIVDAVQRGCYQTNLARNRFTLHRNSVANAQIQRALVYQQDAEVPFAEAAAIAANQTKADLPTGNQLRLLLGESQHSMGKGESILRDVLGVPYKTPPTH
jgi:hypothetical protein